MSDKRPVTPSGVQVHTIGSLRFQHLNFASEKQLDLIRSLFRQCEVLDPEKQKSYADVFFQDADWTWEDLSMRGAAHLIEILLKARTEVSFMNKVRAESLGLEIEIDLNEVAERKLDDDRL